MPKEAAVKEFDTTLDSRRRITLRDAPYANYHVTAYDDGSFRLEPRILVEPHSMSERTRRMIDGAAKNFRKGVASAPVNPDDLLRLGK